MLNRILDRFKPKLSKEEQEAGAKRREQIINDAESMKRLSKNTDFMRYCEILTGEKKMIEARLMDKQTYASTSHTDKISLIARVNQIDEDIRTPQKCLWRMENLTEVRDAIKEQTRERQALGNKTGG